MLDLNDPVSSPALASVSTRRPVFLHSGYRSGSTWFWGRFRHCLGAYGYNEPLNVKLATLTPLAIAADRPDAWPSGHPESLGPYNAEYMPLLAPGCGVLRYQTRFAVESYFRTSPDPELVNYLELLMRYARGLGKSAVLGFCSSLGRVDWFRRFVDAWNIVTWRNPRDQWVSMHRQWIEYGNFSFEVHPLLVAYMGRLVPEIAPFFAGLGPIPEPNTIAPAMPLFAEAGGVARRFRVFLRVFTLDMLLAVEAADLAVDLDMLSAPGTYRDEVTGRLRAMAGLDDLCFDDCRLPRHAFPADADYKSLLGDELTFLDRLSASPDATRFAKSLPFVRGRIAATATE